MQLNDLFKQLPSNSTILTPNRRLAAVLLEYHHQYQLNQNKIAWHSLDILPLPRWLQRLWENYHSAQSQDFPLLLSPYQEKVLWENILHSSQENESLLRITETVDQVTQAWSLLKYWQIPLTHSALYTTEDARVFCRWAKQWQHDCQKNHYIDCYMLAEQINSLLPSMLLPEKIVLFGFNELYPLYSSILQQCQQLGVEVFHYQNPNKVNKQYRISFTDSNKEIRTMACWAKALLETNSRLNIACIVPDLETKREQIRRIFADVFKEYIAPEEPSQHFNLSAGKALNHYPLVRSALQLLQLFKKQISLDELSSLLRSPFLGHAEQEALQRAQFDVVLRRYSGPTINLFYLLDEKNIVGQNLIKLCPLLAQHLRDYITLLTTYDHSLTYPWASLFQQQLSALGWPGEKSLDSQEYQTLQKFLALFSELTNLENYTSTNNIAKAYDAFSLLAKNTVFQPQSLATSIQILGMLEGSGLPFDATWVMGMDDINWPPQAKPNPFIPLSLQRQLNMPHATAERELLYTQELTDQLRSNAKEIIFSYTAQDKEQQRNISPLLQDVSEIAEEQLILAECDSSLKRIQQSKDLETLVDEHAQPVANDEILLGVVNLFKQQAACPFRAFAEVRLQAKPLDIPQANLTPSERGIILHKALELVWQKINDLTALVNLSELELRLLISQAAQQALQIAYIKTPNAKTYLQIEKHRLEKFVFDWLAVEKQRPYFKVVAREIAQTIIIANRKFNLRVDRIDELADEKKIIIDYKTGKINPFKAWFGERLDEPQLPLYCLNNPETTAGIFIAQINPHEITFKGMSKDDLGIPHGKLIEEISSAENRTWSEQILQWEKDLTKLADEFYQGNALVDPKYGEQTCSTCALHLLCRIGEE